MLFCVLPWGHVPLNLNSYDVAVPLQRFSFHGGSPGRDMNKEPNGTRCIYKNMQTQEVV